MTTVSDIPIEPSQHFDQDSFIKRIRRKSGVYGEHILYPMTVEGIQWAIERRQQFPDFSPSAKLVVSEKGTALDKPTKSNNANQLIPNHFDRLIKQIIDDGNEIHKLSFGKLRKTASDLIKRFSNGEIAGVFDVPVHSAKLLKTWLAGFGRNTVWMRYPRWNSVETSCSRCCGNATKRLRDFNTNSPNCTNSLIG